MFRRVLRALRPPSVRLAHRLAVRADAARDSGHHLAAAMLYEEALRLRPRHAARHIQAGHMFKEAGELVRAEPHYLAARDITPNDPDLALQIGHFYKIAGRLDEADHAYARAAELTTGTAAKSVDLVLAEQRSGPTDAARADVQFRVVPELLPRPAVSRLPTTEVIHLAQLGRIDRTSCGTMRTVRGVTALRGSSVSAIPLKNFEIYCDGSLIHAAVVTNAGSRFIFNVWHDFSTSPRGRHQLEFVCHGVDGTRRSRRETIVVAPPLNEAEHPDSDAILAPDPSDSRSLDTQINARPSEVRPGSRQPFAAPRTVLVQRVDQLGDLIVSIPAIRRLREILYDARIVGLLSNANAELAATLDLFDDIIVIDFPEERSSGRRVMPRAAQQDLMRRLIPFEFDVAIDLSENGGTRDLLLLSGAQRYFAFGTDAPWLSAGVQGTTHDPANGLEMVPPSRRMVGMVEWIGAIMREHATVVRRADLPINRLAAYGMAVDKRYILLHAGARLTFSRWPHFATLARLLLERTEVSVVYMPADASDLAALPPELSTSPRLHMIAGQIPFDDFDALLSCSTVMVGNDSGPKHLAALRGVPVVSIHMARLNWSEWGQEQGGLVISRKVPCAGCGIHRDADECGKDLTCITRIAPEEVFSAILRLL